MRRLLLIVLVLFPLGLIGWIVARGLQGGAAVDVEAALGAADADGAAVEVAAGADAAIALPAAAEDPEDAALRALLATPLDRLTLDGEVTLYDDEGLFDYINGAAPIFIERKFRRLAAVDLKTAGGGELTCDIYDMGATDNAAAIYAKERPAKAAWATIGEEGYRGSMALVFRQGRYYVKLTSFDTEAEAMLPTLAALLVRRMAPAEGAADGDAVVVAEPARDQPADPDVTLRALLRAPLAGAEVDGQVTLYDDEGLFDYINGAAPIFIERKFRRLAAVDLKLAGEGELTCDIYDMGAKDNAAAIYAKERPGSAEDAALGDQSHLGSMALVFRRGPYYVKLTAFDAEAEAFLPKLAALLVERMK